MPGAMGAMRAVPNATGSPLTDTVTFAVPAATPGGTWKLTCRGETKNSSDKREMPLASLTEMLVPPRLVVRGSTVATCVVAARSDPYADAMASGARVRLPSAEEALVTMPGPLAAMAV